MKYNIYSVYETIGVGEDAYDSLVDTFASKDAAIEYVKSHYGRLYVSLPWQGEA